MTRLIIVGVITSAALIIAILALIRTRRLQERYAILWLIAASGVVVFGLWTAALEGLADALGIAYPPNALFLLGALFAIGVLVVVVAVSAVEPHGVHRDQQGDLRTVRTGSVLDVRCIG